MNVARTRCFLATIALTNVTERILSGRTFEFIKLTLTKVCKSQANEIKTDFTWCFFIHHDLILFILGKMRKTAWRFVDCFIKIYIKTLFCKMKTTYFFCNVCWLFCKWFFLLFVDTDSLIFQVLHCSSNRCLFARNAIKPTNTARLCGNIKNMNVEKRQRFVVNLRAAITRRNAKITSKCTILIIIVLKTDLNDSEQVNKISY